MKSIILFLLLVTVISVSGQQNDPQQSKVLSPAEMEADLDSFERLLRETHPGLFRYQTREEFDQQISTIQSKITEPLPFYTFYQLLARLGAEIRCAHTQVFPTRDIMQSLRSSYAVLPIFTYPVEEQLYVLFNGTEDESIKPGYEILSINGHKVPDIRDTIGRYYFRDGYNDAVLRRFLQGGLFSMYYYLTVEQPENFDLELKNLDGEVERVSLPALDYSAVENNYVKNSVNSKMMSFYNKKNKNWDLQILDDVPSTAYLSIASFGAKGVDTEEEARESFQKFMDNALKKIRKKNIRHLIIELRGNSGGWDIQGKELFSYLMKSDSSVLYYENQNTITTDSEFLMYSDVSEQDLERSREFLLPQDDGTFRLDPAGNETLQPQAPKENRFEGDVYILMDEQCASTCAEFTAVAKANGVGVLVGNESGGAYEGGNGGSFIQFVLPHSGIYVSTPLVKYEMAVPPAATPGKGTLPDYKIMHSKSDILSGYDAPEEFVHELIRKKEAAGN